MDRSKCFNLLLYEEDATHSKALEFIKQNYDYAMICHDKDLDEENKLLKPHYHVVIRFKNAKYLTALAKELEIAENYIEISHSMKQSLLYLIHYFNDDKHQYNINEVQGTLKKRLQEYIKNEGKSESEKVLEIFEEIDKIDGYIYITTFCRHVASMGYWEVLRRSTGLVLRYLDEHNSNFR